MTQLESERKAAVTTALSEPMSWRILVCVLLVLGCMGRLQSQTIESGTTTSPRTVLSGKHWKIRHPPALEADARKIDGFMEKAYSALCDEFAEYGPKKLLENVRLTLQLHAKPNDYASTAVMTLHTSYRRDTCNAELHLLAPSKHGAADRTMVGDPKDDAYFHKTLVHEYASLFMAQITRKKPKGWRFSKAPNWFIQGYPEFLSLTRASEFSRKHTLKKYKRMIKDDPNRVDFSFGVEVHDPYTDGAMIVAFMHDTFGANALQQALASRESTFGRAITQSLGVDLPKFASKWKQWLAKQ
ncbi:MAG: hypothetical protein MI923_28085 [Phycisphaerales bacterium]|nr:hypothetical protein [Phycisphaerales bacterium]